MVKRVFFFCMMEILRIENELACTYQASKAAFNMQAHTVGDVGSNPVWVSVKEPWIKPLTWTGYMGM